MAPRDVLSIESAVSDLKERLYNGNAQVATCRRSMTFKQIPRQPDSQFLGRSASPFHLKALIRIQIVTTLVGFIYSWPHIDFYRFRSQTLLLTSDAHTIRASTCHYGIL